MSAMTDTDSFAWVEWLIAEREAKGMTQADLARAANLTRTAISDYENRQRANPQTEALVKISVALGYPPEYLPRLAGILPPEPEADPVLDQISHLYSTLRYEQSKQQAIEFLRFLTLQEERAEYNAKRKKTDKKK